MLFTPAGVVGIFLNSILEEVVFRGLFYQSLRLKYGILCAVFINAFVFSLFHLLGGILLIVITFIAGISLAYLFEKRRSIIAPIFMHITLNYINIMCKFILKT